MPVTLSQTHHPHCTDAELELWRGVPVSIVVDLEPQLQIDPAIRPIKPAAQQPPLVGRAVTAHCETPDFGAVLHALDQVQKGDVLVIATAGITSHAMIGEILCGHLRDKGAAGVICDGAIRDVNAMGSWPDFSVYTRAITPRGPDGKTRGQVQTPVNFGGITITPGDLILGDDDGLVAVPSASAAQILQIAQEKMTAEESWIKQLKSGVAVADVFGLEPAVKS